MSKSFSWINLPFPSLNSEQHIKHASGTMETVSDVLELGRVPIKLGTTGLSADLVVSL